MKLFAPILLLLSIISTVCAQDNNIFNFTLNAPRSKKIEFKEFTGRPLLIINIATRCGYTGQLDDIEKLFQKYKDKGLRIVGIPSNDFGGQTPESDQEVVEMCRVKYGASFPITTKSKVLGENKHPIIKFILKSSDGKDIKWNFEKFLFDKSGKFIKRFDSSVLPLNSILEEEIKKYL